MKLLVVNSMLVQRHIDRIKQAAAELGLAAACYQTEADIPQSDYDADIIYGFAPKITRTSSKLKWLCVPWAGVDSLMAPDYFANADFLLTNSAGAFGVAIAEHMVAVALIMMRQFTQFFEAGRECRWLPPLPQRSLKDSRITVLGTGDIGTSFARRVRGFEPARITGVCRSGRNSDPAYDEVLPVSRLDELLPETDLLAMSLPSTAETKGILSRERLALLPEDAYVINVGRGSAIDEAALAERLEGGQLAGAALDVLQTEPLPPESPLWKTKNLLITPHVSGIMMLPYTKDRNVDLFLEDLHNFMKGKALRGLVDRTLGY
ncbi:MAG: D-2-hydroxyacid dehydrogenase [Treponema sp.]|nr:D-2-hydroxyacid dehydrogenase [Treponema sp.]